MGEGYKESLQRMYPGDPLLLTYWASLLAQMVKNLSAMQETQEMLAIPGLGRSSGEGNGNPLQYFCLGNATDWGAWHHKQV